MSRPQSIDLSALKSTLPARNVTAHKGDFGTILVIGGSPGMSGAVLLAGEAALRAGAGRVIIATHPEHAACLNVDCPELMVYPVLTGEALAPLLAQASHIVLGPGLAADAAGIELFQTTLATQKPCVIDAGALAIMATHPFSYPHGILTPHPGEAARLLGISVEDVQANRPAAARRLQTLCQGVIVLKGHDTLIDDGNDLYVSHAGNPGMATAGMGDVLSGVIAGLWPQVGTASLAAQWGVALHGTAGDQAAKAGMRGLIASDLLPFIRSLLG
jgi:NAD(P)H-hydrate epimerase